jgi:hypothetical protein
MLSMVDMYGRTIFCIFPGAGLLRGSSPYLDGEAHGGPTEISPQLWFLPSPVPEVYEFDNDTRSMDVENFVHMLAAAAKEILLDTVC